MYNDFDGSTLIKAIYYKFIDLIIKEYKASGSSVYFFARVYPLKIMLKHPNTSKPLHINKP